jgi:hypothetical protein
MKKKIIYSICAVLLVVAGCTKFDEETPIPFVKGPGATISIVATTDSSVAFTVTPDATAGYYSYLLVAGVRPAALDSSRVLKLSYDGVAKATINYKDSVSANIYVEKLTPNTAYMIYAVAANTSGMAGAVTSEPVHTGDNGAAPAPKSVAIADSTIAVTFSEPIVRGAGAVLVTFHAVNAQAYPPFNPTVAVPNDSIAVDGTELYINLPPHPAFGRVPAGAFVTVTYEAGAVKDLSGIDCAASTNTGEYDASEEEFDGLSARVDNFTWDFKPAPSPEDTLIGLTDWATGYLVIAPDSTLFAPIAELAKDYQFVYKEAGKGKAISLNIDDYKQNESGDTLMLPTSYASEEAARGAIIDAIIPKGAFEDVFGNQNAAFAVEDIYIYSYGYDKTAVLGTYDIEVESYWDGPLAENGIVIEDYGDGSTDTVLVKNLIVTGTELKAVFDGVLGTLTIKPQLLLANANFGASGIHNVYFANIDDDELPVVLNVPAAGTIISPANWWGYTIPTLGSYYDIYTSSTWTRQP